MKKMYIILLSVMILSVTGCGSMEVEISDNSGYEEVAETEEQTKVVLNTHETEMTVEENPVTGNDVDSGEEEIKESNEKETQIPEQTTVSTDTAETEEQTTEKSEDSNTTQSGGESQKKTPESQPEQTTEEKQEPETESEPEKKPDSEPKPEPKPEIQPVGYSPDTVIALAIAKCQMGGMITTQDNLANALAEGRITQEEYNEYYPYDGLESSYYSVFIETDLNIASKIDGTPLRSEDAIATYIANMLLLEQNPVFNIVYAGVYSNNGTDFYEFRCLR